MAKPVVPRRRPAAGLTGALPPVRDAEAAQQEVRTALGDGSQRLFVIDDDPTGSQTVAGVPLLLRFQEEDLRWAVRTGSDVIFALTNSRSLPEADAEAVNRGLGARIQRIADESTITPRVLSRSDSTLRGHFPAEVLALDAGLTTAGAPPLDATLLCPAFVEAGRVTVDDVHWVLADGIAVPVAETEFARDPVLGYTHSNLREWIAERCGAGMSVASVGLDDIRCGGVDRVTALLAAPTDAGIVILNAATRGDLDVLAQAIGRAETSGRRFLYRSGPSLVAARAGRPAPEPVEPPDVARPGLVVVGSHTALTTRQLDRAVTAHGLRVVELRVDELVGGSAARQAAELRRAVAAAVRDDSRPVALVTTRAPARALDSHDAVAVKTTIATALVEAVREIVGRRRPGFLLAKGGITSHDVAHSALATGRATVLGQLFPGQVALWRLDDSDVAPGLSYVVFPGNVGGDDALAQALDRLTRSAS